MYLLENSVFMSQKLVLMINMVILKYSFFFGYIVGNIFAIKTTNSKQLTLRKIMIQKDIPLFVQC